MDGVLEKGWVLGQLIHADERYAPFRGGFRKDGLDGQSVVFRARCGAEEEKTRFFAGRLRCLVEQAGEVCAECFRITPAGQRGGGAVAEHDHIRFVFGQLFQKLAPAFSRRFEARLEEAEPVAGITGGRVRAPAEIPKRDIAIGKLRGRGEFDPTGVLLALDEAVAE